MFGTTGQWGSDTQKTPRTSVTVYAIYADDDTLWTKGRSAGQQEGILQDGLDVVTGFLESKRLKPSSEETVYIVIANNKLRNLGVKDSIHLHMGGTELQRFNTKRAYGSFISLLKRTVAQK